MLPELSPEDKNKLQEIFKTYDIEDPIEFEKEQKYLQAILDLHSNVLDSILLYLWNKDFKNSSSELKVEYADQLITLFDGIKPEQYDSSTAWMYMSIFFEWLETELPMPHL